MSHARFPLLLLLGLLGACATSQEVSSNAPILTPTSMEAVAEFIDRQPTGVAVSREGRIFVNFPRWGLPVDASVVEIGRGGRQKAYPDASWNQWLPGRHNPAEHFISVQSVVADKTGFLWVLDPASPGFRGVVPGGAKLVQIELSSNQVVRIFTFDSLLAPKTSYLNDVRIDPLKKKAYITDSGLGALLVVDLKTGRARRILDRHPALHAEVKLRPQIGGMAWQTPDGSVPKVHVDGIALDLRKGLLYFHALTGKHLYRIPTVALNNPELGADELGRRVTDLGPDVVCDGMLVGPHGEIYLTALETNAIMVRQADGSKAQTLITDPRLRWPDSLAWGPDGNLYATTSQIHLAPDFRDASGNPYPFGLWRIRMNAPKVKGQ
ncbi:MAG: hypothetical protein JRF33_21390 [Deltaproteobacteria bacterium]|nr:hypothetical protein [Deltaproteobacteria bacterium]